MNEDLRPGARPIRILLLEHDERDEELVRAALRELPQSFELVRVSEPESFRAAVEAGGWSVILADFSLPGFDGLAALALVRERDPDLPFILVTGSLPEERAVEVIRMRATDFVPKDRLVSLPHAIERALREVEHARRARDAEERARLLIDAAVEAIVTIDQRGRFASANPAAQRLTGYPESELLGNNVAMLMAEPFRSQHDSYLERYLATGEARIIGTTREVELLTKEGRTVPVDLSVSPFQIGDRLYFAGFFRDLSERKRMEEQLRQSQKLEAIGSLAAGIAHDFNNVLAVVTGYSELALEKLDESSVTHGYIEQIRSAGEHAARLTRQLLAFGRKQVLHPEVMSLRDLVEQLAPMLQRVLGERISLEVRTDPETPLVRADESQLQQVLFNLTINARDAMPDGGRLLIETSAVDFSEDDNARHEGMLPGRYAGLVVSDTGQGMSAEVQQRIFEPFFTTKGTGRGTGLGLATVLGIVRQSGGWIWFYSEPARGTTFKVFLPALADRFGIQVKPAAVAGEKLARSGECIAVVEDDPAVRKVVTRVLVSAGYEVLEFGTGREAVEALASSPRRLDLLVSDLVMPDLAGDEVALALRRGRPELGVLFMSGYAADLVGGKLAHVAPYSHIAKPFSSAALRELVRRVIDEKK